MLKQEKFGREKGKKPSQKTIFRCSHMLSLTAAIIATGFQKLLNSKAKQRDVPKTGIKRTPDVSHTNNRFFIDIYR
jgi:hypothetical protein